MSAIYQRSAAGAPSAARTAQVSRARVYAPAMVQAHLAARMNVLNSVWSRRVTQSRVDARAVAVEAAGTSTPPLVSSTAQQIHPYAVAMSSNVYKSALSIARLPTVGIAAHDSDRALAHPVTPS